MHIESVQIENYKSFRSSVPIQLSPGVNVLVGQNNTGKTSLVESLGLNFSNQPHLSSKTFRPPYTKPDEHSIVTLRCVFSGEELREAFQAISPFTITANQGLDVYALLQQHILEETNVLICRFRGRAPNEGVGGPVFVSGELEGLAPTLLNQPGQPQLYSLMWDKDHFIPPPRHINANAGDYTMRLSAFVREAIYAFKAERYNLGATKSGTNRVLAADASNLAEVLSVLSGHPANWDKFNRYVRLVFPEVHAVSVEPADGQRVEIKVWNEESEGLPQELAVPLAQSGTGLGQVLSILAVVLMADFPRTIIVDEPQSFLHPGALRTLVQILAEHSQHQFLIATHSPIVITASRPSQVIKTRRLEAETQVEYLNPADNEHLRVFLRDIGARLSDVFGMEQILWVDGATEEACYPEIMRHFAGDVAFGVKVLAVQHTGDFEPRNSKTILSIYRRLSAGEGLLPPAVGFLFDRELRDEKHMNDLIRQGKGKVSFLDRRMFENYLVDSKAIAAVMAECQNFRELPVTPEEIDTWMDLHRQDARFVDHETNSSEEWLAKVDAAKLLHTLFEEFSEARHTYRKVEHGLKLTRLILDIAPASLEAIGTKISSLLKQSST